MRLVSVHVSLMLSIVISTRCLKSSPETQKADLKRSQIVPYPFCGVLDHENAIHFMSDSWDQCHFEIFKARCAYAYFKHGLVKEGYSYFVINHRIVSFENTEILTVCFIQMQFFFNFFFHNVLNI